MSPVFTDETGEFVIKSTSLNDWIILSPPSGFKTKRINLNGRDFIRVFLTPEELSSGDDPLKVLGGSIAKKNIIASFTPLNLNDIDKIKTESLDRYMQGRVAGLHVTNMSSQPGSGAVLQLRGLKSLNANTQPFILIDGIPAPPYNIMNSGIDSYFYNPLLLINPFDISSATVIKDPVITSTYGSKASNGLILIETLDPTATQTTIEFELKTGVSMLPSRFIPQLNATQHKTLVSEMLISSGLLEEDIRAQYPNLNLSSDDSRFIDYQHNTDWQKLIFANSGFSSINLGVKGGDEIAKYGLSFGYFSDNGIIKTTKYQGYNLRFVGALNIFRWLKMNTGVSILTNTSKLKESARVDETSPILSSLAKTPLLNPYKYDVFGKEINELTGVDELGISNPVAIIDNYEASNTNNVFNSSLGLEAALNRNLILTTKAGLTYNVLNEQVFMPNRGMAHYYNLEAINVSQGSNNNYNSFFNNTSLRFNKIINENHYIVFTTGMNLLTNKYQYDWGLTKNAPENDQYRRLQNGTNNLREIGGQNRMWNWISYYENVYYSYQDKYLLSGTINLDGSSRVGDSADNTISLFGLPFGLFYSAGAGWKISKEAFLKDLYWLDEIKIRTTYGKSGNDDVGETNSTKYYNAIRYRNTIGLYPGAIYNDNLTYESVTQIGAGVDIAILAYRFSVNADIYKETTDNLLVYAPMEPYFGYSYRAENGGSMDNTGWELSSFLRVVNKSSFKWDIVANISGVKNKVSSIIGDKLITPITGGEIVNMVGEPANSFYGYRFEGVYSTTDEATAANLKNNKEVNYRAGDSKFADLSGPEGTPDGIIDEFDKTIIGSPMPDLIGGLSNTFSYKNWSLNLLVQFVKGNEIFNYVRYKNERLTGIENQSSSVLDRWQYEGQLTEVPRADWKDRIGNTSFSDRWIENGSYIRLKSISLSYEFKHDFLAFRNARIYVSANNLFTLSEYLGYDPEVSYSYMPIGQGVDYGLPPQNKSIMMGINIGF